MTAAIKTATDLPLPTWAAGYTAADLGRIVRKKEACILLGVARTTLHRMEVDGKLPPAIKISTRARGWRLATLLAAVQAGE